MALNFYTNAFTKGNEVFIRGIRNGKRFAEKVPYRPLLFFPNGEEPGPWRTPSGQLLTAMRQANIYSAKDFIKKYDGVEGMRIYGLPRFVYAFLNETYNGIVEFDRNLLRIVFIDLEMDMDEGFPNMKLANKQITAATCQDANGIFVLALGPYDATKHKEVEGLNVEFHQCQNERELLTRLLDYWVNVHPDIVSGWSVDRFDLPYLYSRIKSELGVKYANKLSPWGLVSERIGYDNFGKEGTCIDIGGVSILDYLALYRKFTYNQQESYRLGHIANVELGTSKLSYTDYSTLQAMYERDHQRFVEYNIQDVLLVQKLDEKMKLIDLALAMAYDAKVNYTDVMTQVRLWDVLIHNYLWERQIAVPVNSGGHKNEAYAGAYVKDPQIGSHDWVLSFDLNSMYPNLIRMFNISPETILNQCHQDVTIDKLLAGKVPAFAKSHTALGANGWVFRTDVRGFLPEMMEKFYGKRVEYKNAMQAAQKDLIAIEKEIDKQKSRDRQKDLTTVSLTALKELERFRNMKEQEIAKYKNLQLAKKLQLNSCYGALG